MYVNLYLRRGTVFIPTVAVTESGLCIDVEPVQVVRLGNKGALQTALERAMAAPQPRIADLKPPFPPPVVLKYARARSLAEFERDARTWTIDQQAGHIRILPYVASSEGGWTEDASHAEGFPVGATASDVAKRVVKILDESA